MSNAHSSLAIADTQAGPDRALTAPPSEASQEADEANRPALHRHSDERVHQICMAALELFAEKGFDRTRLDDIAIRAGVSKSTIYSYFRDKQDIVSSLVRDTIAPSIASIRETVAADMPLRLLVYALLERFIDLADQLPIGAVTKIIIGESRNFPELARTYHDLVVTEAIATVSDLIGRAQAKGEARPGDARLYAMTLLGPMLLGLLWRETFEPIDAATLNLKALARQHAAAALNGLLTDQVR